MNPKSAVKLYKIIDKILLPETTPFIGILFVKIRVHFARKINKSVSKINGFCKNIVFNEGINIGKDNFIGRNVFFDKFVTIGDNNMIGRNCSFFTTNHKKMEIGWSKYEFTNPKPIKIGNNCWICSNCIVLGGVTIGDNSCVAAGSVVTNDIPENVLVAGNPAKIVKHYLLKEPD